MYADLHIHSTFSDSSRSPEEIVCVARERQVSLLSICDHASADSYVRLVEACAHSGLACVSGVELGAQMQGEGYHVLAYNFDIGHEEFKGYIKRQNDISQRECEAAIVRMSAVYPQLSLEDYRAYEYPEDKGGWKYIYYAVDRGVYATYEEAASGIYPVYFVDDLETSPVEEFCAAVKRAGGVPVIAHPGNRPQEEQTAFLRGMLERGMEGVECFYPSHNRETTQICLDFARRNGMRITCGSDCHGDFDMSEGFTIGSLRIPMDMLNLKGIVQ